MKKFPFKIMRFFSLEIAEINAVDLRITSSWMIVILFAFAVLSTTAAFMISDSQFSNAWQNMSILMFVLAGLAVYYYLRHELIGIIFILTSLILIILAGLLWLRMPNLLPLLFIPVILAGVVRNLRLALAFAGLESLILILLLTTSLVPGREIILPLALIWISFAFLMMVYAPVYQAVNWYRTNFYEVQAELIQLRAERVDRAQLIEDLDNANRQMVALYDKTSQLRWIAEEAEKSKAMFVAKVSHEFRTPLSMIIGLSGLIMNDRQFYGSSLPSELLEDMAVINRNCDHLANLVDDVLDLTRAESGQLTIHREWIDMVPSIQEAVTEIKPLLEKKKLDLLLDFPDNLPQLYCDQVRIRQVILNLIGNAARYTEHGNIRVKAIADEQYMIFEISDTGPGIAEEDMDIIFEPFVRGRSRPAGEASSSGLGLSICRQFIQLHGGQIWVKSKLGQGSTFSFKIPFHPQEEPQSSPTRWINQEKLWEDRKPRLTADSLPLHKRILVYDLNDELVQLLHHFTDTYDFIHVMTMDEVIQQSKQNPVSAVLINGSEPEMIMQTVEQARLSLFDTPVLGCVFPRYLERLRQLGVESYLVKPIKLEALSKLVGNTTDHEQMILLIDDDQDLRDLLVRMLESLNSQFSLVTAASGEEGLRMMQAIKPDLVILDIMLGGMSGWDVLETKNTLPDVRSIPVVILSGNDPHLWTLTSPFIIAAYYKGLAVDKLLESVLDFSSIIYKAN